MVVDEDSRPSGIPQRTDRHGVADFVQDREVVFVSVPVERVGNRFRMVERIEEALGILRLLRIAAVDREAVPPQEQRGALHVAFDAADDPGVLVDETNAGHS